MLLSNNWNITKAIFQPKDRKRPCQTKPLWVFPHNRNYFIFPVRDDKTQNYQAREETKDDDDRVTGSYRVVQPDGRLRVVE